MNRAQIAELLAEPHIMLLTLNRGGKEPLVAPIWYSYEHGQIRMWIDANSAKVPLLRRNPAVTLCVQQEERPYKAVLIRGVAELRPGADWELSRRIAVRYLGEAGGDAYVTQARERPGASPTMLNIKPTAWRAWDYATEGDTQAWIADADLR